MKWNSLLLLKSSWNRIDYNILHIINLHIIAYYINLCVVASIFLFLIKFWAFVWSFVE